MSERESETDGFKDKDHTVDADTEQWFILYAQWF